MVAEETSDPVSAWQPSSMAQVAEAAGVSVSTVSRALRGASNVRPETALRIRDAAASLRFAISPSAAGLASGKVRRIALLLGSPLTDWFSGSILDAIYRVVRGAGFDLLLYRVHDDPERRDFFATLPAMRNADALIVASFELSDREQETLERLNMPVVYLNQRVAERASVRIDDVAAGRAATRYLYGLGHRNFRYVRALYADGFSWSASDRYEGFRDELARRGDTVSAVIEEALDDDFGPRVAAELASGDLPVAVVAEYDELGMRLLLALWRQGTRVPEDVSVIGFDGEDRAARFGLTTVAQPVDDLASTAAALALQLANGTSGELAQDTVFPTAIRVGMSTRAPDPAGPPTT